MKLNEIAGHLGGILEGPGDIEITGPAKVEEAESGDITFISNSKYKTFLKTTKASAVIIDKNFNEQLEIPHIKVENAYMGFLLLLKLFDPKRGIDLNEISKNSNIARDVQIGENTFIGPGVFIGSKTKIGRNCKIYPGVIILENVVMGDDCILYPYVSVREYCIIGNRVIIQNGAVIGADGFGFAPHKGSYQKIPQIGNVIIHDDVEIGANTTIDRATVGATRIGKGSKLDNLIMIAHNCSIGENTVIAAQTGVAGSTKIGSNVTIGGQVGINGHINIGDSSIIAAQSGVTKDVEPNSVLMGLPAIPIMENKRINVSMRKLPENMKRIFELEKELLLLKKKIIVREEGNE
jgi:UDP-3-O-[3-hydroxymyristoyl] glucosamine N-acyltransferase